MAYIVRVIVMFLITWTGVRLIGRKSISEMTSYDLAAVMLMTTVASEPLVYKITSKSIVGVSVLIVLSMIIGKLSLKRFFYKMDSKPILVISDGEVMEDGLKRAEMSIALLLSELRVEGYKDPEEIRTAYLEPSGKLSIFPKEDISCTTSKIMNMEVQPISLTFPLILNGKIEENNLKFLQKDEKWLMKQLKNYKVKSLEEVIIAQYNTSGQLILGLKEQKSDVTDLI